MEDTASGLRIGDYHRSHHSGHAQQATGHSDSCASCNHVSSHEFTSAELELTDSLRSHLGLNIGSDLRGKTAELEAVWPCSRRDRCPSTPCDSFGTAGYQTVSLREFKMAATERVSPGTSCVSPAFRLRHDQVRLQRREELFLHNRSASWLPFHDTVQSKAISRSGQRKNAKRSSTGAPQKALLNFKNEGSAPRRQLAKVNPHSTPR